MPGNQKEVGKKKVDTGSFPHVEQGISFINGVRGGEEVSENIQTVIVDKKSSAFEMVANVGSREGADNGRGVPSLALVRLPSLSLTVLQRP